MGSYDHARLENALANSTQTSATMQAEMSQELLGGKEQQHMYQPHLDGLHKGWQHVHGIDHVWSLNFHSCQLCVKIYLDPFHMIHGLWW